MATLPPPSYEESGEPAGGSAEEPSHVSPKRAFLLSMVLPGLGQRSTGHHNRAVTFGLLEASLWTTFAVLKIQGNTREEDFEEWAKNFANAKVDGYDRDEEYYQTVSRYLSSDDYNFETKLIARLIFPNDRAAQLDYIDQNTIRGDDTWEWVSNERRNDFRVIRHRSLEADRRANWTIGGLVLLRVVSGIDAALGAHKINKLHDVGLSISPSLPSGEPGVSLDFSRAF